jgi:YidC/Oxa1 family membrane protein insertase
MSPYALLDPLVHAFNAGMTGLAGLLPGPTGGVALVAAIAALTVALRAALLPAAVSAYRANQARAALVPELAALRKRYRKDRVRLAEEINKAHRRAGVRPFAGTGAMLVQGLAVASLYRAVVAPAVAGHANALVGASVLGAPLTAHWPAILAAGGAGPLVLLAALLAGLVAVAWAASRLTGRQRPDAGRLARAVPYGTPAFALLAPAAVGVYLLTSTTWTLLERTLLPQLVR